MDIPVNPLGDNPEGPIPSVDPADLRSVWEMQRELQRKVQARRPGGHFIIADEMYKRACSPGANVGAVWYRLSQIGLLQTLGMLAPWVHDGVIADAVFKIAATFPMNGMAIGVPRQEFPFDVQEFIAQVTASAT